MKSFFSSLNYMFHHICNIFAQLKLSQMGQRPNSTKSYSQNMHKLFINTFSTNTADEGEINNSVCKSCAFKKMYFPYSNKQSVQSVHLKLQPRCAMSFISTVLFISCSAMYLRKLRHFWTDGTFSWLSLLRLFVPHLFGLVNNASIGRDQIQFDEKLITVLKTSQLES